MKKLISLLFLTIYSVATVAQSTEIDSKSVRLPRYADLAAITAAISSPVQGMLVYNIATQSYWFRNSSAWTNLAAAVSGSQWTTSGNDISNNNSGSVGIGTSILVGKLDVNASTTTAVRGVSSSGFGVQGLSNSNAALYGFSGSGNGLYAEVNGGTQATARIVNNNGTGNAIDANNNSSFNATGKFVNNGAGIAIDAFNNSASSATTVRLINYGLGNALVAQVNTGDAATARILNTNGTGNAIEAINNSSFNATGKFVNANASGLALQTGTGNVAFNGYTKLGGELDAPKIKMRKFTGVMPSTEGGAAYVYNDIEFSKILSVNVIINGTHNNSIEEGYEFFPLMYNGFITVNTRSRGRSTQVLNQPFSMLVIYEE